MNPSLLAKFFPTVGFRASRPWSNASPRRCVIEVWISGALELRRSIDMDAVLSMADRFGLRYDTLTNQQRSFEDPERLFCLEGSARTDGEIIRSAFLARWGKVCAVEMSATVSLERLLSSVFEDYLEGVMAKMGAWRKTNGSERIATIAQNQGDFSLDP